MGMRRIHKGYNVEERGGGIAVYPVADFSLKHIFECGQCFRWRPSGGAYHGVAKGKSVAAAMESENVLILAGAGFDDFANIWYDYFDLGADYGMIKSVLSGDKVMREAVAYGWGIRILRQDFFETLISFILSANNRIPMIMNTVEKYCSSFGGTICSDGASSKHGFPPPEALANLTPDELRKHGGGFRCKYITATAKMYIENPGLLQALKSCSTGEARGMLKSFPGVGDKVADCTMLFSGLKPVVFPVDVWVRKIMEKLYFCRKATDAEIQAFAAEKFGAYTGIAQQYLFYYARENGI